MIKSVVAGMESVERPAELRASRASSAGAAVNVEVVTPHAGGSEVGTGFGVLMTRRDSRVANEVSVGGHGVSQPRSMTLKGLLTCET